MLKAMLYGRRGYPPRDPVSPHPTKKIEKKKKLPPTNAGDKNSTNP
jgi:hypothetical protein